MAVLPEDTIRVQMNWSLLPDEIAVSTFGMVLNHGVGLTVDWPVDVQTAARKVYDKWVAAAGTSLSGMISGRVKLHDVSVYHLSATTGKSLDKGSYGPTTPWTGQAVDSLPNECALAVSLYGYTPGDFIQFPRRWRGRMYLPPMSTSVMENSDYNRHGRLQLTKRGQILTSMSTFFNDLHRMSRTTGNHVPLGGDDFWGLCVVSRRDVATRRVKTIRVGDVMDVQRRRRNRQREVYADATISDS
jgi:hypothetical protein